MSQIRFENVWKVFSEEHAAVRDLNLEIEPGEFLVLVGPSGCGKTTTLRMLAGLERPSRGRILLDGRDITNVPSGKRDFAMVFQSYALYPHLTVRRNLAFGPKIRHEDRAATEARIASAAEALGLTSLLDRKPGQLSGGQRQRVALGRALIRNPAAFLMDEPLSNLDAALRVQMRAEVVRLHRSLPGTTTVYVTHDQIEALTMGDRIAVLKDGELLQVGTPQALYDTPATQFVASFIGSPQMNFLPAQIIIDDEGPAFEVLGNRVALDPSRLAAGAARPRTGTKIKVGLRPQDIGYGADERGGRLSFTATIKTIENTGNDLNVTLDAAHSSICAVLPRFIAETPGEQLTLGFDPNDLYVFDDATGSALTNRDNVADLKRQGIVANAAPDFS